MLAYAASRPRIGARQPSPNALLFVICAHIVVIAVIMSAKIALPPAVFDPPTKIIRVRLTPEPPPHPVPVNRSVHTAIPESQDRPPNRGIHEPRAPVPGRSWRRHCTDDGRRRRHDFDSQSAVAANPPSHQQQSTAPYFPVRPEAGLPPVEASHWRGGLANAAADG